MMCPRNGVNSRLFFGLAQNGKPIYIPWDLARRHKQIIGMPGSGKGVTAQVWLPQYALQGDGIFVFDPKRDSKLPVALAAFAKRKGVPFHLLDLSFNAPPQFNILNGAGGRQIANLFNAGFDLADSGDIDRVYRLEDRQAAALAGKIAAGLENPSLSALVDACADDERITNAKVFWGFLNELAELPVTQTASGYDLARPLREGGICYVMGDPNDTVCKMLLRMVLVRVLMLIYTRDRDDPDLRHVCLFLDEFKHMLSAPALDAMGMIRDYRAHMLLAYQSRADLKACPGLSEAAVSGTVNDNIPIKLVFRAEDNETVAWATEMSGTCHGFDEHIAKNYEVGGAWQSGEVPHLHANTIRKLPDGTGAVFGLGPAFLAAMQPLPLGDERPRVVAAPDRSTCNGTGRQAPADGLI